VTEAIECLQATPNERWITRSKVTREIAVWVRAGKESRRAERLVLDWRRRLGGFWVWLCLLLGLGPVAFFDLAHKIAAAEEVGAELRRNGARDDGELVARHLRKIDGSARRDEMNAPLKDEREIPEDEAGEYSGARHEGGAGGAERLGEAIEKYGETEDKK